jgi:RimJ/RimL family protein N-acetyltransferase
VRLGAEHIEQIRLFRNCQIEVLRQTAPISAEEQVRWYEEVVSPTHESSAPEFLLVSILDAGDRLLGYGGLTNVSWPNRRAEVSFLVDPPRAADPSIYREDFTAFLAFLREWGFGGLSLNRLFTETFAFRKFTIELLEEAGFVPEGRLRQHTVGPDDFVDSLLHGLCASDPA